MMERARKFWLVLLVGALLVPALAEEKSVAAGDRLNVTVYGEKELSHDYLVDQEGNIVVPLIGKVLVKELSLGRVRETLTQRLARFIRAPQVTVEFRERATITVSFTGSVRKPGLVKLPKGSRVSDGLAFVGGLAAADADEQHALLRRRGRAAPQPLNLTQSVQGDASRNQMLEDGDLIEVPSLPVFSVQVLGAVRMPGMVARKRPLTLLEAVQAVGGVTVDGDRSRVDVQRKGLAPPQRLNLDHILTGKVPNPALQAGDVVTVASAARVVVKVFGFISKPGERSMKPGTTVLEAVTAAGGFALEADRTAVLLSGPEGELRELNLAQPDSSDLTLQVRDGDRLFIPQQAARRYSVSGGVRQPGRFAFPQDPMEKVYLTDALAQANGLADRAKKLLVLVRKDPTGREPSLRTIDFDALLTKKDPLANPEILPDDIIFVEAEPRSKQDRARLLDRMLRTGRRLLRRRL